MKSLIRSVRVLAFILCSAMALVACQSQPQSPQDELLAASQRMTALYGERKLTEALPIARMIVRRSADLYGRDDPEYAAALGNLGVLLSEMNRADEAERVFRRAVEALDRAGAADSADGANLMHNLAVLYAERGRLDEAEDLQRRALGAWERTRGADDPKTATAMLTLANLLRDRNRLDEAEELYSRSADIRRATLGPDHPELANNLEGIGGIRSRRGRPAEALAFYREAQALREAAFGPDHPDLLYGLYGMGEELRAMGRFDEAEPLYRRALEMAERSVGVEHPVTAHILFGIGAVLSERGRYDRAERFLARSLEVRRATLPPEHPDIASSLNGLGVIYSRLERPDDALAAHLEALDIVTKALGPDHPRRAGALQNLGAVYQFTKRYPEAERAYRDSIAIMVAAYSDAHPEVAGTRNNLATLMLEDGRPEEAEALHREVLATRREILGDAHPDVASSASNLANTLYRLKRREEALDAIRQATEIYAARAASGSSPGARHEQRQVRGYHTSHLAILAAKPDWHDPVLVDEALIAAQRARSSDAAQAVARMAQRFSSGNSELARRLRERQDLLDRLAALEDEALRLSLLPADLREPDALAKLQAEEAEIRAAISAESEALSAEHPRYSRLATPRPVALDVLQAALRPGEAVLSWTIKPEEGSDALFLIAVTPKDARFFGSRHPSIGRDVKHLRLRLDPKTVGGRDGLLALPVDTAHSLYRALFDPLEDVLAGVETLYVVPDGPLQSLPPGVLLTEPVTGAIDDVSQFADMPWLAKRHAIAMLPSVGSLIALRSLEADAAAREPFLGIGDPLLADHPGLGGAGEAGPAQTTRSGGAADWLETAGAGAETASLASLYRGAGADVSAVRALPALPDTADELAAMARYLETGDDSLLLRTAATETALKDGRPLDRYAILAFATHGLVAGELPGVATEPALVMTPPDSALPDDDGLLTASEISALSLNADWVILSACNTAAPDGSPGADGLSGLAKAFFHAGARSLFVSHWPVVSSATVKLTTGMLRALAETDGLSRAAAHQRAMLALMADPDEPMFAHPLFWAPFVIAGEAGAL